jgi:hypothetical protein
VEWAQGQMFLDFIELEALLKKGHLNYLKTQVCLSCAGPAVMLSSKIMVTYLVKQKSLSLIESLH